MNLPNSCIFNAAYNQKNGPWASKTLKLVVGSQAFHGFWEYGGPTYTSVSHFRKGSSYNALLRVLEQSGHDIDANQMAKVTYDAHAWLEDAEGRVYDFITRDDNLVAEVRKRRSLGVQGWVVGVPKADLERMGVTYLAAPPGVHDDLLRQWRNNAAQTDAFVSRFQYLSDNEWANIVSGADASVDARLARHVLRIHPGDGGETRNPATVFTDDAHWRALLTNKHWCASCETIHRSTSAVKRCGLAWYCNAECQRRHWTAHKRMHAAATCT